MRPCPQCNKEIEEDNRFCKHCGCPVTPQAVAPGVQLSGDAMVAGDVTGAKIQTTIAGAAASVPVHASTSQRPGLGSLSISDDAAVAGDVIGVKKETRVSGDLNVTNVSNMDDTKRVHQCAITGEHLTYSDVRTCPSCSSEVSSKVYEASNLRCFSCRDVAEAKLKAEIESRYGDDFRIDAEEAKHLIKLQSQLKISRDRYQQLEREVREKIMAERRYDYAEGKSGIPGIKKKIETAAKAITQNKPQVALKLLQPTWEECRDNKEYETVYLASLMLCDAEAIESELEKYTYDDLSIHVFRIRSLSAKASPDTALKQMTSNRGLGFAYRNEPEWRLLGVELSIDQALLGEDELLKEGHLEAAREELDEISKFVAEDGDLMTFMRGYLACVESAGHRREAVAKWLTSKLKALQEMSHVASSEIVKLSAAILSKLLLLKNIGVELTADNPEPEPQQPAAQSAPAETKCRHCGFTLPQNAQFCGSCGKACSPVRIFLESIGLAQYAELFDNNRIDETVITEISEQDLKNIGIASLGHRKRIAAAIPDYDWPD